MIPTLALLALLGACTRADKADAGETGEPDCLRTATPASAGDPVVVESIATHPEIVTVLVARWCQLEDGETWLSWELDGQTWSSPVRAHAAGDASEVVLGLPAETALTVTLHALVGDEERSWTFEPASTGALPVDLIPPTLTIRDPARARTEPYLLTSVNVGPYNFFGPCYVVILDAQGRIVWYRAVGGNRLTLFPRVARAGDHLIWDATTYYTFDEVEPGVIRATLDLSREEETLVPYLGLTFDELPDGRLLFDYNVDGFQYYLATQDEDGTQTWIWDCYGWMKAYVADYWACAPNTVLWREETNTVIWSMFRTSTVVEIDLETGEMSRQMGRVPGGWIFDPPESNLMLQHYPNVTEAGTLLLTTHVMDTPGLQVIREFSLDDEARKLTQVWSYSPESGHYGEYAGEALRLPSGDTLIGFGTDGAIQEVTSEGEVVWELDWSNHLTGHATPIADLYALSG